SAGELVGIAAPVLLLAGQAHLAQDLGDPCLALVVGGAVAVRLEHLADLPADTQRRVERGGGVLGDVGHGAAAEGAPRAVVEVQYRHRGAVVAGGRDRAAGRGETTAEVAQGGESRRRLARSGLADEREDLAGGDVVGHPAQDGLSTGGVDAQVVDDECVGDGDLGRHAGTSFVRPRPAAAEARESVMRLVPTVRTAMATTGSSTPHGSTTSAMRFSLIISPQSAVGGWMPRPRNDSEAT